MQFRMAPSSICPVVCTMEPFGPINWTHCRNGFSRSVVMLRMVVLMGMSYARMYGVIGAIGVTVTCISVSKLSWVTRSKDEFWVSLDPEA